MRLSPSPPHCPRITWWGDVFLRRGGGEIHGGYDNDFYAWWSHQVPGLEHFPYGGLYFCGDLELILPPGKAWGEMGEFFLYKY